MCVILFYMKEHHSKYTDIHVVYLCYMLNETNWRIKANGSLRMEVYFDQNTQNKTMLRIYQKITKK